MQQQQQQMQQATPEVPSPIGYPYQAPPPAYGAPTVYAPTPGPPGLPTPLVTSAGGSIFEEWSVEETCAYLHEKNLGETSDTIDSRCVELSQQHHYHKVP
jgi:hypothetical protein